MNHPNTDPIEKMILYLTGKKLGDKKRKDKAVKFPVKLMYVLECGYYKDIICWCPSGCAFLIMDPLVFERKVLPDIFKEAKFSSFERKVRRWGFVKAKTNKGTKSCCYGHPCFRKGDYQRCMQITCSEKTNSFTFFPSQFNYDQHLMAIPSSSGGNNHNGYRMNGSLHPSVIGNVGWQHGDVANSSATSYAHSSSPPVTSIHPNAHQHQQLQLPGLGHFPSPVASETITSSSASSFTRINNRNHNPQLSAAAAAAAAYPLGRIAPIIAEAPRTRDYQYTSRNEQPSPDRALAFELERLQSLRSDPYAHGATPARHNPAPVFKGNEYYYDQQEVVHSNSNANANVNANGNGNTNANTIHGQRHQHQNQHPNQQNSHMVGLHAGTKRNRNFLRKNVFAPIHQNGSNDHPRSVPVPVQGAARG